MKFQIPKVIRPLHLAEYADELADATIWVWVNPPVSLLERRSELASASLDAIKRLEGEGVDEALVADVREALERIGTDEIGIIAELWSQKEGFTWSADDILALVEQSRITDPALWAWLQSQTRTMIREHRNGVKKA